MPLAGGALSVIPFASVLASPVKKSTRNIFEELGVRTFINAAGTYTFMTGSLMRDAVTEAIMDSAHDFCLLDDLQDKVGEKIAAMVHAEATVVTSGAFSALTLGLAGILTGTDPAKVAVLPQIEGTGLKSEVIVQKMHAIGYNHAFLNTGCKIIAVETAEEAQNAINSKTALMHFLNIEADKGQIQHEEWVAIAKKNGIPVSIDIAADVPPVSNLWRFNDMGFDFVALSGGKAIRGPQSSGLLMGKKDIIAGARAHMPPRGETLGRGMKVNKEEIIGLYVALETFIALDHEKEARQWAQQINVISDSVAAVPAVNVKTITPQLGNVTPTLTISWGEQIKLSGDLLQENLRKGNPSIEIAAPLKSSINVTAWMLKPGQEKIVAKRIKEELEKASV